MRVCRRWPHRRGHADARAPNAMAGPFFVRWWRTRRVLAVLHVVADELVQLEHGKLLELPRTDELILLRGEHGGRPVHAVRHDQPVALLPGTALRLDGLDICTKRRVRGAGETPAAVRAKGRAKGMGSSLMTWRIGWHSELGVPPSIFCSWPALNAGCAIASAEGARWRAEAFDV